MSFDSEDKTRLHILEYNSMWRTGLMIVLTLVQVFTACIVTRLAYSILTVMEKQGAP